MHRMGAHIHIENSPCSKVLRHARILCGKEKMCRTPSKRETAKGLLDPPSGERAEKRKGGHHLGRAGFRDDPLQHTVSSILDTEYL